MPVGHIRRDFADGSYPFALPAREVQELERLTDAGPLDLYRRLLGGGWKTEDFAQTIRLGLIGAARQGHKALVADVEVEVTPLMAARLVDDYVRTYAVPVEQEGGSLAAGPKPWGESAILAAEILGAGVTGFVTEHPTEPLGKKKSTDPAA